MLTEQHDFSTGLRDRVKMRLEEMYPGVEIVANEEYPRDTVEFRNQLLKIQGTEPEIILLSTAPGITSSGALIKQMGEMSDWEVQKIGPLPLINEVTLATGAAIEGTIMVDVPTIDDADFAAVLDVIHSAQGGTDNIGSYYAASTYDSLVLLIDLIAEHGEDVDAVRTALEEGTFEGHLGEISFAPTHYPNGIGAAAFVVKDGALKPLE